ncbi:hypothetical protein [Pontibacter sp. G13]|uniref:gliding motility protein GldB-related protein n=1 Tax=Pontibacter sp. G13 TaxID=3074898 RepID=UPI00288BF14B|nr:hypothetical protein [Pontibacter sp. G13]WNJ17379.1 hypothetical protein RJD25_21220 [Pontibacter sp. G13]
MNIQRTDLQMEAASKALHTDSTLQPLEIWDEYLAEDRDYYYEWLSMDLRDPEKRLSDSAADSLMAGELVEFLADPNLIPLYDSIQKTIPSGTAFIETSLIPPLKRLSEAYPNLMIPMIRTHINGYDPSGHPQMVDQVVFTDHYLTLGIHYFLGPDLAYYSPNIPGFLRRRFQLDYLPVLVMRDMAEGEGIIAPMPGGKQPTFLDQMIRAGIKQYFLQEMLPYTPDSMRLLYTDSQMDWANTYESRIYKELMGSFYDTNFLNFRDYLSDKPYTTQLSSESAPRIGEYLGWKIVNAYMNRHPEVTLSELTADQNYDQIFKSSKYRPA